MRRQLLALNYVSPAFPSSFQVLQLTWYKAAIADPLKKQAVPSYLGVTLPVQLGHCNGVHNIQPCNSESQFITFPINLISQYFWNGPSHCLLKKIFELEGEREGKFNLKSPDLRSALNL